MLAPFAGRRVMEPIRVTGPGAQELLAALKTFADMVEARAAQAAQAVAS